MAGSRAFSVRGAAILFSTLFFSMILIIMRNWQSILWNIPSPFWFCLMFLSWLNWCFVFLERIWQRGKAFPSISRLRAHELPWIVLVIGRGKVMPAGPVRFPSSRLGRWDAKSSSLQGRRVSSISWVSNMDTYSWNSSAQKTWLFSHFCTYSGVYFYQYGLVTLYFTLWFVVQYHIIDSVTQTLPALVSVKRPPVFLQQSHPFVFWALVYLPITTEHLRLILDFPHSIPRIRHFPQEPWFLSLENPITKIGSWVWVPEAWFLKEG